MDDFYDRLAPLYDLIFLDWDASMEQQAGHLAAIIGERWGSDVRTILDVACGIGTQSIGLASKGFAITASDLSAGAVERAQVRERQWMRGPYRIERLGGWLFQASPLGIEHRAAFYFGGSYLPLDSPVGAENTTPLLPDLAGRAAAGLRLFHIAASS